MKKSLILLVLTALLCLVCALALTACEEEPEAPAPVCQHRDADDNALCDKCNESYTDGTDVTVPPTHAHSWSAWSVTTPATCNAAGVETRTCACGENA